MIIVSACLAGINCRFDGKSKANKKIIKLIEEGKAIPICPEQLAGLPTPRIPSEIFNGKVIRKDSVDLTKEFYHGAEEALKITLMANCKQAILKNKSPACGCGKIYDGSFSGKLIDGDGIFTKLLKKNNVEIIDEAKFD